MSNPFYSQGQNLFDRYWSVELISLVQTGVVQDGSKNGTPVYGFASPGYLYAPDDDGYNLKTTFSFKKTSDLQSAIGEVAVWNLSPATRGQFDKGMRVILKAGYYGLAKTILIADVMAGNVKVEKKGPDVVTTFPIGSAERQLQTGFLTKSYPPGTSFFSIVADCSAALDLTQSVVLGIQNFTYNGSVSLHGPVKDSLQMLCRTASVRQNMNISAFILDDELIIKPRNYSNGQVAVFLSSGSVNPAGNNTAAFASLTQQSQKSAAKLVNVNTGIIGTPYFIAGGVLHVTSLLNPDLNPGQLIQVASETVNGLYTVSVSEFKGDSHGTDAESWIVDLECFPVDQPSITPNLVGDF